MLEFLEHVQRVLLKFQRDQPHHHLSAGNYLFLLHMEKSEDQEMTFANKFFISKGFP